MQRRRRRTTDALRNLGRASKWSRRESATADKWSSCSSPNICSAKCECNKSETAEARHVTHFFVRANRASTSPTVGFFLNCTYLRNNDSDLNFAAPKKLEKLVQLNTPKEQRTEKGTAPPARSNKTKQYEHVCSIEQTRFDQACTRSDTWCSHFSNKMVLAQLSLSCSNSRVVEVTQEAALALFTL